jgi:hypothetical protein
MCFYSTRRAWMFLSFSLHVWCQFSLQKVITSHPYIINLYGSWSGAYPGIFHVAGVSGSKLVQKGLWLCHTMLFFTLESTFPLRLRPYSCLCKYVFCFWGQNFIFSNIPKCYYFRDCDSAATEPWQNGSTYGIGSLHTLHWTVCLLPLLLIS